MFASDDGIAALLRQATALKESGDWGGSIAQLRIAKTRMLASSVSYPAETWCRLPLYLQQAGRMSEAMAEFQFLLDDLPRRARRDTRLDDPSIGPAHRKQEAYERLLQNDGETIRTKQALAEKREVKRKAQELK